VESVPNLTISPAAAKALSTAAVTFAERDIS
jgi:hypothetical protein